MTELTTLLQQGTANAWLFVPTAILLGALHGLEPGHSKTMMAAFIVAIHGTVKQAILLGIAATISHTAIVWLVALGGIYFGSHWNAETTEPYFQLISAVIMAGVALWMVWRISRNRKPQAHGHSHNHHHGSDHHHDHDHNHDHDEPLDDHARQHADDIKRQFGNGKATTGQIIMFGLTGGLLPCPAAITVLLLCLQLKAFTLGAGLVLCFSIGLAVTLVMSGVIAALGMKHAAKRWSGLSKLTHKAPYFSAGLILLIALYVGYEGAMKLFF